MVFSVIIPTYNRAILLQQALDSVFAQSFTDYEVIVIDDGSTDQTAAVLATYGNRIRVIRQQNKGPGPARNLGLQKAIGNYIALLDSDDVWFPWTLDVFATALENNNFPTFLVGQLISFHELDALRTVRCQPEEVRYFPDYLSAAQQKDFSITTCSSVVLQRVETLRAGAFFENNSNAEDSDLWLRLGESKGFVEIKSPICCGYRQHPCSAVANVKKTYSGLIYMLDTESHGGYPGGLLRSAERRIVITRHVRPASFSLALSGAWPESFDLYRRTFRWHIHSLRIKYLLGYWLLIFKWLITRRKVLRTND